MAALGLRCHEVFSLLCGLLTVARPLVDHRLWGTWASVVVSLKLSGRGLLALKHASFTSCGLRVLEQGSTAPRQVESFQTRDGTRVSSTGRRFLSTAPLGKILRTFDLP